MICGSGVRQLWHIWRSAALLLLGLLYAIPAQAMTSLPAPDVWQPIGPNHVNTVTGKFMTSTTDASVGSGAGALAYTRFWSDGGWRSNLIVTLSGTTSNPVVTTGVGASSFTLSSGSYVSDQLDGSSLVSSGGYYIYTAADGTETRFTSAFGKYERYDSNLGLAEYTLYPNGLRLDYHYRQKGYCLNPPGSSCGGVASSVRLQSVTNNLGFQIKINYASNTLDYYTDLDAWNTISKVVALNNGVDYCDPAADSCSYTGAWSSATYGTSGGFETVTDGIGNVTRYAIGSNGITAIRRPTSPLADNISISYDGSGFVSSMVVDGVSWTYGWAVSSGVNRVMTMTRPLSTMLITTTNIATGQLYESKDGLNRATGYIYDAAGHTTYVIYPEGNKTKNTYDASGRLVDVLAIPKSGIEANGIHISRMTYPTCTSGNRKTCWKPDTIKDALGNVTTLSYDTGHGGVTDITYPNVTAGTRVVHFGYATLTAWYKTTSSGIAAAASSVKLPNYTWKCQTVASCGVSSSDAANSEIVYQSGSSSAYSNLAAIQTKAGSGTSPTMATTSTAYDDIGNVKSATDALGNTSYSFYDVNRRTIGMISPDPDGAGALWRRAVRYSYNADSKVIKVETGTTNGIGSGDLAAMTVAETLDTTFDAVSRKVKEVRTAGSIVQVGHYSYDDVNRLACSAIRMKPSTFGSLPASACTIATSGTDEPDRITQYAYDAAGQVIDVTSAVGTAQSQVTIHRSYNLNGKVLTETDANGNKTSYEYDSFDRLSKTYYPSKTTAGTSNSADYEQLTYDLNGNVTQRRLRDTQTIGFTYDALGQVTARDLPSPESDVTYSYDLSGRLSSAAGGVTNSFSYDALGRRLTDAQPFGSATYQYDAGGRRTRLTWNDGFYVTYDYLNTGEMSAIRENGSTAIVSFTYDSLGRRTLLSRSNGTSTSYSYDAASRLTCLKDNLTGGGTLDCTPTATGSDQAKTFAYNQASQITGVSAANDIYAWTQAYDVSRNYTSNGLNQYSLISSTVTIVPTYDGRGNLTSAGGTTYAYYADNLLKSASGATAATLYYDSFGRMTEYDTSVSTRFAYDGPNIMSEVQNASGNPILRRYVFGPGDDEALVWYEGNGTTDRRWLHADERGSIVAVSNASGNAIAINSYDAWGIPALTNLGRFQYTGQAYLPELGLYNYKARIYSPTLGRFLQTDPTGYADGMNMYAYVGDDPINATDPTGLATTCPTGGGSNDLVVCASAPGNSNPGQQSAQTQASANIASLVVKAIKSIFCGIFGCKKKTVVVTAPAMATPAPAKPAAPVADATTVVDNSTPQNGNGPVGGDVIYVTGRPIPRGTYRDLTAADLGPTSNVVSLSGQIGIIGKNLNINVEYIEGRGNVMRQGIGTAVSTARSLGLSNVNFTGLIANGGLLNYLVPDSTLFRSYPGTSVRFYGPNNQIVTITIPVPR